jgi:sulfate adenylyltransferase subunit 2
MSATYNMTHLQQLEAESVHILREVAAEFERPVLLYSVGKDSSVLLHLARKAFHPGTVPFPLLHVDTGFKFRQMYDFRDEICARYGVKLVVYRNEAAIKDGANPFKLGTRKCCALLKTEALLDGIRAGKHDAAIGGARRDEDKSRAKERVYSFRDSFGQWDPKNQRPELWNLYNGKLNQDETIRVFPISNWTELDVWQYIHLEQIPIVPLYYAKKRKMVVRDKQLIPVDDPSLIQDGEKTEEVLCRFRTLGCSPCTGAIRSDATTVEEIIQEMMTVKISERSTRIIDHDSDSSMESKKREGYF